MLSRWQAKSVLGSWVLVAISLTAGAAAEDAYYRVDFDELKLTEGKLPSAADNANGAMPLTLRNLDPYVVLDGPGEAYVLVPNGQNPRATPAEHATQDTLVVRVPEARKIAGTLFWPKADWSGLAKLRFAIDGAPSADAKAEFAEAKEAHYRDLLNRGLAGAAWFRHQIRELRRAAGKPLDRPESSVRNRDDLTRLDDTFALLGGGRAISENLQLDRALPIAAENEATVPLDSLKGISVTEIDWKPLIKDMQPASDPLAKVVPADQHIVLFPNVTALAAVQNRLREQGTVLLRVARPTTSDPGLVTRYQRQLCLPLADVGRIAEAQGVGSVALTGSDPYFQLGTDVALIFEAAKADELKDKLWLLVAVQGGKAAKTVTGKAGNFDYRGLRSPDRRISSYLMAIPGAVVVANSTYQLERIAAVATGQSPAIVSLDEFTFFRNRYPRDAKDESALVFISDPTIRRWCGPRWRIAASRETRDAAVLAELQAAALDKLVKKQATAGALKTDLPLALGGEVSLAPAGVQSSTAGTLEFMTPIAELKFDSVTKGEADAYNAWRDRYQDQWRWAFDPIALKLSVGEDRLAADLSIVPLIVGSDYRQWIDITRGSDIAADAGDRHDALAEFILAFNTKSPMLQMGAAMAGQMAPGTKIDPLSWMGKSLALYIDDDPFWQELADCKTDDARGDFFERNWGRLPAALWIDVSSGLKLTAFLAAARAVVEQTSPGMVTWEAQEYRNQAYVKVTPTERALSRRADGKPVNAQLYYVASGTYFLLTPSEAVLKRALDRQAALAAKPDAAKDAAPPDSTGGNLRPWLGKNVGMQFDGRWLPLLAKLGGERYQQLMQSRAWNNLPILNEWRRLYPDQNPVALHERFWQERLICPGGGEYVWNGTWQTMESTVYGHPGQPKSGPAMPPELANFRFANFGLTLENQGLRGQVSLERAGKTEEKKP